MKAHPPRSRPAADHRGMAHAALLGLVPDRPNRPDPNSDEEAESRLIRRWLRAADEMVRKRNGKKGGDRTEAGERPENERREPPELGAT